MTETKKSYVTTAQEQFARDRGWVTATECGWKTEGCWVSSRGTIRVSPDIVFGEHRGWVAAFFYRCDDNIPFSHKTYPSFEAAIAANTD